MGKSLVRFQKKNGAISWGCLGSGRVFPLESKAETLAKLLEENPLVQAERALQGIGESLSDVELLSPITPPCQIICQGKNYLDHLLETGVRPQNKDYNLLFSKADSSLAAPKGRLLRPPGVRLLDYEIELGLVIGRAVRSPVTVNESELGSYVVGLVLANDISARDVQIPERQWFRGKSYRGFCPTGPVLYLMEAADWSRFYSLELCLKVNDQTRQKASLGQLMHRPPETIELISRTFDLRPGDLLLTGTPGGVSMRVSPKKRWEEIADVFLSDKQKFARFIEEQEASGRYLREGDRIEATIRTVDGAIDLGKQELVVH